MLPIQDSVAHCAPCDMYYTPCARLGVVPGDQPLGHVLRGKESSPLVRLQPSREGFTEPECSNRLVGALVRIGLERMSGGFADFGGGFMVRLGRMCE